MPPQDFSCKRCGHCCTGLDDSFRNTGSRDDVRRWIAAGRWDIMRHVQPLLEEDGEGRSRLIGYRIWIDPATGVWCEDGCPWFSRVDGLAGCAIRDLRPDYCREFPTTREHADSVGCPGFWA